MNQNKNKEDGKHLAIFLPTLVGGGAERVMMNLAEGFIRRNFQVDFLLAQREGAFVEEFPTNINLIELNKKQFKFGRSILSLPALAKYLSTEQPDVLLTGLHANIIAIWAKRISKARVKVVITEHNNLSIAQKTKDLWFRIVSSVLIKNFYLKADHIIAVSKGVARDLSAYANIPLDKIDVIYNPIITSNLLEKVIEPLEHPWFKEGQPPVILAAGRLSEQKDFSTLLKAFVIVKDKIHSRLLIIGEGPERNKLESIIKEFGLEDDVSLPGFIHNPYPIMKKAAAFALSSRWEGLPTVLVEALYCGTPIVSTDCQSGPVEILQNGKFGHLVPVGDHISLANKLIEVLRNPPPKPPVESWKIFETEFVLDQYEQLIIRGKI